MKPFLGIDLTKNKKNEEINGKEFMVQTASVVLANELENSSQKATEALKKSSLPPFLRIIECIMGFSALVIAVGILKADVSLSEGYHTAPYIFWCGIGCAIIWFILWLYGNKRSRSALESDENIQTFSHLESISDAIFKDLAVPDDAKTVDVLTFFYKVKDGKIKVLEKGFQIAQYFNPEFKIFSDEENLYLADVDGKYSFPLSSVVKIHTVKKRIRIAGWNKEEKHNKGIYKQYKLAIDNYGCVCCKEYHIVEINYRGNSYGIYIPCYELPIFEEHLNKSNHTIK